MDDFTCLDIKQEQTSDHEDSDALSFICGICDEKYSCYDALQTHLLKHSAGQPLTCDICDKTFQFIGEHKLHMMNHSVLKKFSSENDKAGSSPGRNETALNLNSENSNDVNGVNATFCRELKNNSLSMNSPCDAVDSSANNDFESGQAKCKDSRNSQFQTDHIKMEIIDDAYPGISSFPLSNEQSIDEISNHYETTVAKIVQSVDGISNRCEANTPISDIHVQEFNNGYEGQNQIDQKLSAKSNTTESTTLKTSSGNGRRKGVKKGEKPSEYNCIYCVKSFPTYAQLSRHTKAHTVEKKFACDHENCTMKFGTNSDLKKHKRTHTGEKPHECPICKKRFTTKGSLNRHVRSCRPFTGVKTFACEYCGKTFTKRSQLKRHVRIHTGEKPFKCEFCGRSFCNSGDRKQHMRIHTGERPYACDYCDKTFSSSSNKKQHIRIHTGYKPFICDFCGKAFRNTNEIKRHIKIHIGEKTYKCDLCEKRFSQHSNLQQHFRIHTGEKPYVCDYCEKAFSRKSHLNRHYKIHTREVMAKAQEVINNGLTADQVSSSLPALPESNDECSSDEETNMENEQEGSAEKTDLIGETTLPDSEIATNADSLKMLSKSMLGSNPNYAMDESTDASSEDEEDDDNESDEDDDGDEEEDDNHEGEGEIYTDSSFTAIKTKESLDSEIEFSKAEENVSS